MTIMLALAAVTVDHDLAARWEVYDRDTLCVVSRGFPVTEDHEAAVVTIMPWPLGERTEITIITDGSGPDLARGSSRLVSNEGGRAVGSYNASALMLRAPRFGQGTLVVGDHPPIAGAVASGVWPAADSDTLDLRLTTIDLRHGLPAMHDSELMTIATDVFEAPAIELTDMADARAQLRTCQDAQLRGWGMDPDEQAKIATPAQPGPGVVTRWFSSGSYPARALAAKQEGNVIIRWQIGLDGTTSDCAPVRTSGSEALDQAACAVILERRYDAPARDGAGQAMVSHGLRRVAWRLPRD